MEISFTTAPEQDTPRSSLSAWITAGRGETLEAAAFLSGAALARLDAALADPQGGLPAALLRDRLALQAAEACLKLENRRANAAEIRDAVCLARAGDALGPAGEMFDRWRRATRIELGRRDAAERLAKVLAVEALAERLRETPSSDGLGESPVARAAAALAWVLQASRAKRPRR